MQIALYEYTATTHENLQYSNIADSSEEDYSTLHENSVTCSLPTVDPCQRFSQLAFNMNVLKASFLLLFVICCQTVSGQQAPRCPTPGPGDNSTCQLPDCRCSGSDIPGDLPTFQTPQIVLLSFDSAINIANFPLYQDIIGTRKNPNGANISVTFFVSHEYNDYSMTHQLHQHGHEIALNSITRFPSTEYWGRLNESMWDAEVVQQRLQLSVLANISIADLSGMRAPFLQIGGDVMYTAMYDGGLEWESSRPTWNWRQPGLWPYTNDYLSEQDCQIGPCPVQEYPGFWTVPMIDLIGPDNFPCPLIDNCNPRPKTAQETLLLLRSNFLDQYTGNRAPYGVFATAGFIMGDDAEAEARREGYKLFLDYLAGIDDVYIVSISQMLEWVRSPTTLSSINDFAPWAPVEEKPSGCAFPRSCRYDWQGSERYMVVCGTCPPRYPWLMDPIGSN